MFMQRTKVLALCVAVLLAFSGLASAKQGIDVKASVLFGTKLDVDDVGNIGAEGTGTMKWDWEGKNAEEDPVDDPKRTGYDDFSLVVTGEVSKDAKKIAVSPEEEGYPILLEATYGMDKFQIGGFWLGGFKSEGETTGVVKGFDESNYADFEELLFYPIVEDLGIEDLGIDRPTLESLTGLDAMVFFGGEDFPVLPGMSYYFRHYSKEPGEEGLCILTSEDINGYKYRRAEVHGGIGEVDFEVNPDAGATEWASEVSVNLSNYGGNVGYKLFEQNNIGVTVMVGLEGQVLNAV